MSNQPPTPPGEPDFGGGQAPPPSAPEPPSSPTPPAAPPPGPPSGGQPPPGPPPAPPGGGGPGGIGGSTSPGGYNIGDAFNYGWTKFQANVGPILIGALVLVIGGGIVSFVWNLITSAMVGGLFGDGNGFSLFAFFGGLALSWLVSGVIQIFIQAGITRGALAITYGRPIELQTLLATDNLGQILVGALIVSVATAIGFVLCIIPGLVVLFFTQFFVHFAIDKRLPAMDAIRASIEFVNQNLGTLIGFYIASIIAVIVGFILCLVGAIVAIPVVIIAQAYTYRVLQGEAVAA